MEKASPNKWFCENITPEVIQCCGVKAIIYSGRTKFQSVEILDTDASGKHLILDGKTQSAEADEFIYHEALVQPSLITHPHPETVFIAGGGEGATLREVLRHKSVKRAVMVDIDKEVVDICRKHLPSFHQRAFEDSRLDLHHVDAKEFLSHCEERFDIVIIDLPDPLEGGPAYLLYTQEFYRLVRERLTPGGILSVQAGPAAWGNLLNFLAVNNTLRAVFSGVFPYKADIPSFGGAWGFSLASQVADPLSLPSEKVDQRIAERITKPLRFYDGLTHRGLFSLPKYIREELEREKRIITDREPLFAR